MEAKQNPVPDHKNLFAAMGNAHFDADAYSQSETGASIARMMALLRYAEDAPEVLEYWAAKGLRKELHGDPADRPSRWAAYLPLEALQPGAPKRCPLVFCLHGANNPIFLAESYGYAALAAKEGFILICPENERDDHILALRDYALTHWPVDESRIYSVGYSFGGFMTSRNALLHPELFAGIGMGGMLFAGEAVASELTGVSYPSFRLTEEMLERAATLELPSCSFMGENEMLNLLPLYADGEPPKEHAQARPGESKGIINLSPDAKLAAVNVWRRVAGCTAVPPEVQREAAIRSADIVENKLGTVFERTETRCYEKRSYYIGDALRPDGECLCRFIGCAKAPHWPTAPMAPLIWDFLKRFAREPHTGKLIRL